MEKETENNTSSESFTFSSPGGGLILRVGVEQDKAWYELAKNDCVFIKRSFLSLFNAEGVNLISASEAPTISEVSRDETWEQPWGEQRYIQDRHREVALQFSTHTIRFRLFDDGLGFRYELLGDGSVIIQREETHFNIPENSSAWWIPALGQNHYEHLYKRTPTPDLGAAHTPLTIELEVGKYIAIHEAALYDYGSMNLVPSDEGLVSHVTPLSNHTIGEVTLPFNTPWRTITIGEKATELTTSRIMLNLNEPSKIEDTSWIEPTKFMGIWWGMFLEYFTWGSGPKHGATTANAIRYINACKTLEIKALLIEGWNEGWDGDWTQNGEIMDLMQPYPDFDIRTVTEYAKAQGIDIIGHHETCGNMAHYEWQLPEAYDYYRHFGIRYVKTGYVSPRSNGTEFHSSQAGVQHYQKTIEMAAERKIMLDIHEPVKGTGIERTWPNLLTREGVMGQEYEGSGAVTPEHTTVLPFTRLLSGPLDYTPGLFNLSRSPRKVHSTLAKQLAFYITLYSPLQMVADLPEHYEGKEDAFQFIKDVPTNWETTVPIDGVISDYFVVARKDYGSNDWYVGGLTDENERTLTVPLDFLPEWRSYNATIYRDAEDAHWELNPETYVIEEKTVTNTSSLIIQLAAGGGFAIRLTPHDNTPLPY